VSVDTRQYRDPEGKPFGRQIVDTARDQCSGWADSKFTHPITQEVRAKSAYVRRAGGCLVSCGFYAQ